MLEYNNKRLLPLLAVIIPSMGNSVFHFEGSVVGENFVRGVNIAIENRHPFVCLAAIAAIRKNMYSFFFNSHSGKGGKMKKKKKLQC